MGPGEALVEGFFGLIMALDLSNFLRLALIGKDDALVMYTLSVAIIGCNIAWGLADGLMNALSNYYDNQRQYRFSQDLRGAPSDQQAMGIARDGLKGSFGPVVHELIDDRALDVLSSEVVRCARAKEPEAPRMGRTELAIGAITVAMNVLFALPILAVYLFLTPFGINLATLVANLVGMAILFAIGYYLDKKVGPHHLYSGMLMAGLGFALLVIIIALGG